jgi:hypothetical protein
MPPAVRFVNPDVTGPKAYANHALAIQLFFKSIPHYAMELFSPDGLHFLLTSIQQCFDLVQ